MSKFSDGGGTASQSFGRSVAVDDGVALVGADATGDSDGTGSVYVFELRDGTWERTARFSPDETETGWFGWTVALEDDTALVGGSDETETQTVASLYAFERLDDGWARTDKLLFDEWSERETHARSVALSGNVALVGAIAEGTRVLRGLGTAYVVELTDDGWSRTEVLVPGGDEESHSPPEESHGVDVGGPKYGFGVGIDGDVAVVSQPPFKNAYFFERTDGVWELATVMAEGGPQAYSLGHSVTVADGVALLSRPFMNRVRVCEREDDGWDLSYVFRPPDGAYDDLFGWSVAIASDTAVIGAPFDDTADREGAGSAFRYEYGDDGWGEPDRLVAEDGSADVGFGSSVGVSGSTIVVGDPAGFRGEAIAGNSPAGEKIGSSYVFER